MSVVGMGFSPPPQPGPPPMMEQIQIQSSKKTQEEENKIEKKQEVKITRNKIPISNRSSTTDKKDKPKMVSRRLDISSIIHL